MLGGRVAEKIFFDSISTGAQDDQQKVTNLAYGLVTSYGMNEKIGHRSYPPPQDGQLNSQRPYSEMTAHLVVNLEDSVAIAGNFIDESNYEAAIKDIGAMA